MPYSDYAPLNTLCEFPMISGGVEKLIFTVYEEDGVSPFNLSGYSISWVLCPYGNFALKSVQKSGTITGTSTFEILLSTEDTQNLRGKYIQQPIIIGSDGSQYRASQGVILIQDRSI